ncbi:glycosyltransferase family 4 protein [Vibrio sp. WXL210]|uniref:glycosyltransferase family 4 protein n=1 Tax=Vibrio sp. WXL210 TaxID=3450709 RepID=UPI003EC5F4B1
MKRKILFVVNVDWFFVSHRLPIARALVEMGYDVHIACAETEYRQHIEQEGIVFHEVPFSRSGTNVLNEMLVLYKLGKVIRLVEPYIMHSVTIKPVIYANIMARSKRDIKRVSAISGLGYTFIGMELKTRILRYFVSLLYRFALKDSQKIIFQNVDDLATISKIKAVGESNTTIIRGSGVDLEQYCYQAEPSGDKLVVMMVSRLLIDKGVTEFLEAANQITKKNDAVKFVLVGDVDEGNPKSISYSDLEKYLSPDCIEHWGYQDDIPATMAKANVVVLPSYREGLPKCLIEAASIGRAVVTTDVPGCRDAVESKKTALLVPVKTIEPLVKAIEKLLYDNSLRHSFGVNGRILAEQEFDIDSVISKHIDIYEGRL